MGGGVPRTGRVGAYAPCPHAAEKLTCAVLIARIDPIADVSLPDILARSNPGTAMAAMMPMIATTISSSISVKPSFFCSFFTSILLECAQASALAKLRTVRVSHLDESGCFRERLADEQVTCLPQLDLGPRHYNL